MSEEEREKSENLLSTIVEGGLPKIIAGPGLCVCLIFGELERTKPRAPYRPVFP
jgi:hypothetical protein